MMALKMRFDFLVPKRHGKVPFPRLHPRPVVYHIVPALTNKRQKRFFVKCWGAPQLNRLLGTRQGICRVPFLPIHIENPVPKSVEITHSKCNSLNRLNQVVTAFCESIGVWLDNCLKIAASQSLKDLKIPLKASKL